MKLTVLETKKEIRNGVEYEIYFNNGVNYQYKVTPKKRIYLECKDCKIENPLFEIRNGFKDIEISISKHFKVMQGYNLDVKCPNCGKKLK